MYFVSNQTSTVIAKFRKKKAYTLTITANNDTLGTVSGSGTYYENDIVRLSASPREGYRVESWSFAPYSRCEGYNFVMPQCDTTIQVYFGIDLTALPLPADTSTTPVESSIGYIYPTWQLTEYDGLIKVYTLSGQLIYSGKAKEMALPRKTIYIVMANGSAGTIILP